MQNFPITNLQKHHQAQALRQQAESGQVQLPTIDPTDPAQLASLNPEQLKLVQAGLYVTSASPATVDTAGLRLPPGWGGEQLRRLQSDYPDRWQEVLRSLVANA